MEFAEADECELSSRPGFRGVSVSAGAVMVSSWVSSRWKWRCCGEIMADMAEPDLWWVFPANHVSLPETIQVKKTLQKTVTVFFFQQVNLVEFVIEADRPFSSHSHDTWPEGNIHLYLRAMEYTIYHFHLYLRVEFTLGHFTRGNIIEQQSLQCFWAPLTIAKWWYF